MSSKIYYPDDVEVSINGAGYAARDVKFTQEMDVNRMQGVAADCLKGHFFCLTGKMWTTRQDITDIIKMLGGRVIGAPRTKEVILVDADMGNVGSPGTIKSKKLQDAERRGCKIISAPVLQSVLEGRTTIEDATGGKKKKLRKNIPVEPIDRAKHKQVVDQVLADLASLGK